MFEKRGEYAQSLSKEYLDEIRSRGFPYMEYEKERYQKCFKSLRDYSMDSVVKGGVIQKNTQFSKLASVFFPYMYEVRIPGKKTPLQSFNSDKQLALAIELGTERGTINLAYSKLRSMLCFVNGSQCVSNFRPEVAKYIYNITGAKKVYDYSMGWGGRMVGFLASEAEHYVGVDVNKQNFEGYSRICTEYNQENSGKLVEPFLSPAEDFRNEKYKDYFDLAFSSPPYFAKEKYSDDADQSYKKYSKLDEWLEGFWEPTIGNCLYMLKPGGWFATNIADVNIHGKEQPLIEKTKDLCQSLGLSLKMEIVYDLPRTPGKGTHRKPEPILFFKKA
jgi:hypothetical protein